MIALSWKLTFYQDVWVILLQRRSWSPDALLLPYNEHLIAFQIAAEKLFFELFGIGNNHAEMLLGTAVLIANAGLLFAWVKKRTDPWLAVMAAALILFLGAAWQTLLWPFEMAFTVPFLAGLGMLLALDREDRAGDLGACALLVLSFASGSLGISFAAAAFADVLVKHRRRGWSRLYLVAIPVALYLGWYLHWGRDAEHHLTLHNVLASPLYTVEGFATAVGSLAGLGSSGIESQVSPNWGRPLLAGLIALAVYVIARKRRLPDTLWVVLAAALSYWFLAAFNFIPGREAASPRYVYTGAIFVLMIAAELARGLRLPRRGVLIAWLLVGLSIVSNGALLKEGYEFFRDASVLTRADIGALEIAERTVAPEFTLTEEVAGTATLEAVNAGQYFEAVDDYGPAGYSPEQLEAAPEGDRHWADIVPSRALPIEHATRPGSPSAAPREPCSRFAAGEAAQKQVPVGPGEVRIELGPGPPAAISLRRFTDAEFPVDLGAVEGDSTTTIEIPRDSVDKPWYVHVEAAQRARVCVAGGSPPRGA